MTGDAAIIVVEVFALIKCGAFKLRLSYLYCWESSSAAVNHHKSLLYIYILYHKVVPASIII